jgi:hypothetical protein
MPVPAQAFLSPRSVQKSVSTRFRQLKECLYCSADAVFLGCPRCKTHATYFSRLHSLQSPILSRLPLQYCELPKHIARGILRRLSTTEF